MEYILYNDTIQSQSYLCSQKGLTMLLSNGNKKVGKDTLILNMTSATYCPSKTLGMCKHPKRCYAMKAERCWPQVLPYRIRQTALWINTGTCYIIADIMEQCTDKIKYIRFSEAGDFTTQEDVDKMSDLANDLSLIDVRVYGYTARKDLDFSDVSDNMIVNGSDFMVHNNFYTVEEFTAKDKNRCIGNCRICDLCKDNNQLNIAVKYH